MVSRNRELILLSSPSKLAAENLFDREYAVDRGGGILKVGNRQCWARAVVGEHQS
jgi:hypothetical protein